MPNERDFVLHSWCVPGDWNAPTVVGGRGAKLLLEGGREMLDMSSLVECSNLGHQHPKLVAAIKAQADKLAFVTAAWGAEPRARARRAPARALRFRGRARLLHAGRRRRQRERGAHRAPGVEEGPRPRRHARPLVPRRELHGHGALGRRPHGAPGGFRGLGRAPRAAALRLPLPLRQRDRRGMRPPRGRCGRGCDRQGRRGPRHRGDDGSRCRQQRHRAARQFLAGAAPRHARARRVPDRGRGDERFRPLRRVVRLAALRRGRTAPTS